MHGSCLCGAVVFEAGSPLRPVIACHCTQCRKTSGHFWAATSVPLDQFHLTCEEGLRWFQSSPQARRGFCGICGASLLWKLEGEDRISLAAGALDGPTGLCIESEWHLADAGDYYTAQTEAESLHGSCLCGANHFTLSGPMGEVTACHCTQCRKLSGHFAASFDVAEAALHWHSKSVAEYSTPGGSQRGFCPTCGSSLYFRIDDAFSVEAGCVENPTGGHLARHIFTANKGDYYTLTDGLSQSAGA
ncbi:MAG: GFA family protein [Cypionkella sp.]